MRDLELRGFPTRETEPGVAGALPGERGGDEAQFIVVFPHGAPTAEAYDATLSYLRELFKAEAEPLLIARINDQLPSWIISEKTKAVLRTSEQALRYDQLFEALLRNLFGPLAPGVSVIARPSLVQAPVGVTWWQQDLYVTDEYFGHVVRIEGDQMGVVLPGLDEPQQLHLDRRKLLIANKGAHQVIRADVKQGGALTNLETIERIGRRDLLNPTSVSQGHRRTLIADTDNHRVLCTESDLWQDSKPRWTELAADAGLSYPCGVCCGPTGAWIADTFNQRIIGAVGKGAHTVWQGESALERPYPVAIAISAMGDTLIVSDETRKRVQFFRTGIDEADGGRRMPSLRRIHVLDALAVPVGGAAVPLGTPCGLSVNRDNRLAFVDRERACVWILNLDQISELRDHADS